MSIMIDKKNKIKNKEIIEYLESGDTSFYESNYGTDKNPCIYYHLIKI